MGSAAGDRAGWALLAGLGLAAAIWPLGCDPGANGPDPLAEAVDAVLRDVGPEAIQPALADASAAVDALVLALDAWAAADADGADAAREAARDAWWGAMTAWQRVEPMQVGPAATAIADPLGLDLRDAITSWPTINPCRVDQETAAGAFTEAGWADGLLVNATGLDALEHLLWAGPENACPAQVTPNSDGAWDALGEAEIALRRADQAAALGDALVADVDALVDAWADLAPRLAEDAYPSDAEALQAVYNALFYLETVTRERKLALPLGVQDCAAAACPEEAESLPSGGSTAWVAENLRGFRTLFTGGEGEGLDDLLAAAGHGELADALLADVDAAIALADALDLPVDRAVAEAPTELQALHDAVKDVTDRYRADVRTVLSLQVPAEAAGDVD
jgi:predicted lipoprotein